MTIEQQAVSALKWSAISKLAGQIGTWAVTLIVIRLLAPEDYGLMAITAVIISVLSSVAEIGLGASIVQAQAIDKRVLAKVAGALLLLNVGLGLSVAASAPLVGAIFDEPRLAKVVAVSALHFLPNAVITVPQALAHREMRFKWLGIVEIAAGLLASIVTLTLAWAGAGVWALVLGNLAGTSCRATLLLFGQDFVRPAFGVGGIGRHLGFGGKLTLARLMWQIVYQLDVLIAGRVLSKDAVGAYSVSLHLATLPMQKIMGVLNQVAFPTVARMQDDLPRLRARLLDALRLLSFVCIPVLWGISAVAPEFVRLVLGDKWQEAILPLQVVTLVIPLRMIATILSSSVSAVGRVDVELHNMLVSSIVLPAAFFLGAQWGIRGLALSWTVAIPLILLINFPRIRHVLGIGLGEAARTIHGSAIAGVMMYAAVEGVRQLMHSTSDLARLVAMVPTGACVYIAATALLDRQIFRSVRKMLAAVRA